MTACHRLAPHIASRAAAPGLPAVVAARRVLAAVIVAVTTGVAAAPAQQPAAPAQRRPPAQAPAQTPAQNGPSGPPNALQGFSQNRDQPVKINADELQVHDKDKQAVFTGAVHLVQGDTDMRTTKLVVFYDDEPPPPDPAAAAGKTATNASAQITPQQQQNQQIKRVEAHGNVIVIKKQKGQKDQTVTGNEGIFDMRANTVTMLGDVHISQGDSFMTGDNLKVNMTTGDAVLTAGAPAVASSRDGTKVAAPTKGRVQGIFNPGTMQQDGVALPGGKR